MQSDAPVQWGILKKTAFRFFSVFFFIVVFPFPLFWDSLILWVGKNILHIGYTYSIVQNGSGDTTSDYIVLFITTVMALTICIIWSLADRKRNNYDRLYHWFSIGVRYYLAFAMFEYGFAKVFRDQFPPLTPAELMQTYGHSSPMGLLWAFMSYSGGYSFFTGMAEILGGSLLLFRRTSMLGAFITAAVLCNIVALNFFYDVPVKIFSVQLLGMALFIAAKDANRLLNFFVFNKQVEPTRIEPYFSNPKLTYGQWSIKFLLIGYALYTNVSYARTEQAEYAKRSFLYGAYNVELFIKNNDTLPPLTTDSARWNTLIVGNNDFGSIYLMNDKHKYVSFATDSIRKTISILSDEGITKKSLLHFTLPDSSHLILQGKFKEDSVNIVMQKIDPDKYLLLSRGFHWVNEYPFHK